MDAVEFSITITRICKERESGCAGCPVGADYCGTAPQNRTGEMITSTVEALEQWIKDNPRKTYSDDFFEKFPNAEREERWDGKEIPTAFFKCVHGEKLYAMLGKSEGVCWIAPVEDSK